MADNKNLISRISKEFQKQDDEREVHEKKSFWATDCEKPLFDLYHSWVGTDVSNPIEAETQVMFSAGKMMELALVDTLVKAGAIEDMGEEQIRVEMEREGVPITGYMDAKMEGENVPVEIKSFYGDYQTYDLEKGNPRESYLKQLAVYMDFMGADLGILFYIHRGTGQMFQFYLTRKEGLNFSCNGVTFDLQDTYKRWAKLYKENIAPQIEPESEYRYKIPVDEIDWYSQTKSNIGKARNGHKVIGDHPWNIQYSSYKNILVTKEAKKYGKTLTQYLGYSDEEIEKIKVATKNYTTKGWADSKSVDKTKLQKAIDDVKKVVE